MNQRISHLMQEWNTLESRTNWLSSSVTQGLDMVGLIPKEHYLVKALSHVVLVLARFSSQNKMLTQLNDEKFWRCLLRHPLVFRPHIYASGSYCLGRESSNRLLGDILNFLFLMTIINFVRVT